MATRTYIVTAVDPETNFPVLMREIKAVDFKHAMEVTEVLGEQALQAKRPVRITSITEQPDQSNSFFLQNAERISAGGRAA